MLNNYSMRKTQHGFTLIEMLVVIVIIGILTAIALPAYKGSVQKAHRAPAKSALLDLAARQEKYYVMNNNYTDKLSLLGYATSNNQFDVKNEGSIVYYQVKVAVTAPSSTAPASFTAVATPVGSQSQDKCGNFTLDSFGRRGVTGADAGCW